MVGSVESETIGAYDYSYITDSLAEDGVDEEKKSSLEDDVSDKSEVVEEGDFPRRR